MRQLIRYLIWFLLLFAGYNSQAQNNTVYGAGISYTNGAPSWTPNPRTSRAAVDTVTGRWYHFNTPGGWQWIGNTVEEIAGCAAPAYTPSKGDSRLVINNCVKPEVYWYDGAAWIWINEGTTYFAGEGIRIENDTIILDSLYVLRFRTGDTTDLNAGAVSWNAAEQTLDVVINQGAVTGQMFQEVLYFTKNQTGAQINDGTVVMAAGTTGNSGKILIAPAIADGSVNSEYILGLATQNLPNGGEGMVTHFGKVRGIQTNGANYGETWVDGDVLYCSAATPGYLTKVLPTAPNLKIPIAIVIHAHPSNGTLFVRPSHFPDLAQINDVQLSSPTNGQVLTYNSTLSRWENATPANQLQTLSTNGSAGNISISSGNTITLNVNDADASATNELQTLSTGTNTLTLSNGGGTVTVDTNPGDDVTGSGANGQVSYWNGTQTQTGSPDFTWDDTNKLLSFTNGSTITEIKASSLTGNSFFGRNAGANATGTNNSFFGAQAGQNNTGVSGTFFGVSAGINNQGNNNSFFGLNCGQNSTGGSNCFFGNNAGVNNTSGIRNASFGIDAGRYINAGTNLNIADNSIFFGFDTRALGNNQTNQIVIGSQSRGLGSNTTVLGNSSTTQTWLGGSLTLGTQVAPAARLHVVGSGTSSSTWTAQFHNSGGSNNALMIRDDGRVSFGTASPSKPFHVAGESYFGSALQLEAGLKDNRDNVFLSQSLNSVASNRDIILGNGTYARVRLHAKEVSIGAAFPTTSYLFYVDGGTGTGIADRQGIYIRPTQPAVGGNIAGGDVIIELPNGTGTGRKGAVLIGSTTATGPSAILELNSTDRGLLFPRMTTTQRDLIATPADGLVIYNTTDNKLQVRAGGAWVDLH